jgi:hypothetical protein
LVSVAEENSVNSISGSKIAKTHMEFEWKTFASSTEEQLRFSRTIRIGQSEIPKANKFNKTIKLLAHSQSKMT